MNPVALFRSTAACLALFCLSPRPSFAGEFAYLENSDSGDVTVIAIPAHTVVSTIKIGPFLDDVTPSHDGRILYVNRYDSLAAGDRHMAESGEVVAVSTETEKILWRTRVDGWPNHLSLSLDDRRLYVPLFNTPWMEVIDTDSRRVVDKFLVGFGGHGTRLSPDGKRIYVGSMTNDVLTVVDLKTHKPVKVLPFKDGVRPFAFAHDESTAYVQLSRLHGFEVVDLRTDKIVREVLLPPLGPEVPRPKFFPHTYNHGLEL
jgi:YVTN family beta-propeller protein